VLHVFSKIHENTWINFSEKFQQCRPELARFHPNKDVSHLSLQQVSHVSAQELFNRLMPLPYQGVSRIEFNVLSMDSSC
jgi:hypothetical protein